MSQTLFTPIQLGKIALQNRVVMAPMTRNRADADGTPTDIMAEHYGQRADAGLIVAEGAWPEVTGQAYCRQPGIETAAHVRGWRRVTDAVHARGGSIVLQIMHSGRIGTISNPLVCVPYRRPPFRLRARSGPMRQACRISTSPRH